NQALDQEMERDDRVVILGEDVGRDGGVFRVTEGLIDKYGEVRVMDTPLAESAIVGAAIGMAAYGLRPIAEIQFMGFSPQALHQILIHAARLRFRSRGRYTVPMVVRMPFGGGVKALEHHSESMEAIFCHTPGLKVVVPATPHAAKGLLISSIRDPDTVVFLEPKKVYRAIKEEVPDAPYTLPIGKARFVQEGDDVTIVTWGAHVRTTLQALEKMEDGVSAELIDLQTLSPWDSEAVLKSVKKTGRALVVQEAPKSFSVASEIAATINEKVLLSLEAPVMRVAGWDITVPLPKAEDYYHPTPERVAEGIKKVMVW
ncbi:MAG: alpha-ketoacid dehydrogenase subunit beta, partial [Candidatus Hydrothermarchaeaceae archaeon]